MNILQAAKLAQIFSSQATSGPQHALRLLLPVLQRDLNTSSSVWKAQPQVKTSDSSQAAPQPEKSSPDERSSPEPEASTGGPGNSKGSRENGSQEKAGSSKKGNVDTSAMLRNLAKEVKETLLPLENLRSYTRKYNGPLAETPEGPYTGTSAISVVKQKQTAWQQAWSAVQSKVSSIPFLNKLPVFKVTDTTAFQKGQQMVEDLKEKYETSDHPVVHKVEEYKERVLSGSEASQAISEIRYRDPNFDMNIFLRCLKLDAPVVTQAFLKHDMETLGEYCGPEILQRLEGLCKAFQQQELKEDPTILFVGDVEMVEMRMMENDPFVICQFHCQQLKCVRDKFGNVVEGSPDTIHRVYYFWGLQQEKYGTVTADGELLPPRWVIKDMLWQSMLALV